MEFFGNFIAGFTVAIQPINLFYCFLGVFIGTLIGVLPGIGPVGTMSLLFPVTFHAPATSTLVNVPGEAAAVVTCLDGYQMMLRGRAGPALGIAAFASFIAGTLSVV